MMVSFKRMSLHEVYTKIYISIVTKEETHPNRTSDKNTSPQ
jgi:hypothetical protein